MKRVFATLACLALVIAAPAAFAQSQTGTIKVVVADKEGGPLKGAQVSAESVDSITKRTVRTNENGEAFLIGLDPATNWVVTAIFSGFNGSRSENVRVSTGETTSLRMELTLSTVTEEVTVTAETPLVDVTSALTGQDITLELTESLPTGRSYQSYLQLVPGVLPDDPENPGNPASRSGLNYSDIGGNVGISRDNFYYLEGINVTDPISGTFGANLNTEIIQEQNIITGGIPAEYVGAPGLISSVVTKSGGNDFTGSINYFFQDGGLVDSNDNFDSADFSIDDVGITVGGPIKKDKVWFFASYRFLEREDDVSALDTGAFLRTVTNEQDQFFGKASYQISNSDRITGTVLTDPTDISGSNDRDRLNTRDFAREQGGNRYTANYTKVFGAGVLDAAVTQHNGELTDLAAIQATRNDVLYLAGDTFTLADQQLGGEGNNDVDERDVEGYRASIEWLFDSNWGHHTLKGGVEYEEHTNFRDRNFVNGAQYQSLNAGLSGSTASFISSASLSGDLEFDVTNTSDFGGLINTIDAAANRAAFYALLDSNTDGTITMAEAGAGIVFNNTTGNPNSLVNYNRDFQSAAGPQETKSEGVTFFVQDTWQYNKWSVNLGVRAEEWKHIATTGQEIYTFDTEYAPRASVVYDVKGDGRSKLSGYYGRYYDPIRNNMTNFAGTLTGRVTEEQVFISGGGINQFVTFRTRGGMTVQDAFFSPTTETPYTDEFTLGYQRDLGNSMTFDATYIKRKTRDILEDYDLALYAFATDGTTDYPGDGCQITGTSCPTPHPDSLFLGLEYFGFTDTSGNIVNPGSNFVIATLEGGERDYEGLELTLRKRFSNRWQGIASYSLSDATGNTNSDSNADFQGDVLFLDPRAPNQAGTQPGLINQLFKAAGSYTWDNGFKAGATVQWNSGTKASRTFQASRRNLPIRVTTGNEFMYAGFNNRWIAPGTVGTLTNPSWFTVDTRLQYNHQWGKIGGEFFVDIFNVMDRQSVTRNQDLVAGSGGINFGEATRWVPPRRFFIGARLSFN